MTSGVSPVRGASGATPDVGQEPGVEDAKQRPLRIGDSWGRGWVVSPQRSTWWFGCHGCRVRAEMRRTPPASLRSLGCRPSLRDGLPSRSTSVGDVLSAHRTALGGVPQARSAEGAPVVPECCHSADLRSSSGGVVRGCRATTSEPGWSAPDRGRDRRALTNRGRWPPGTTPAAVVDELAGCAPCTSCGARRASGAFCQPPTCRPRGSTTPRAPLLRHQPSAAYAALRRQAPPQGRRRGASAAGRDRPGRRRRGP